MIMAYKYYYIDDMLDKVKGLVIGLNKKDSLEIEIFEPKGVWEEEIKALVDDRKENKFQGLIFDLRLHDEPNAQQKVSRYRGSSLAQELRILAKENSFNDCPIILLSATDNLRASMDQTSKDLFDLIIEKDFLGENFSYELAQRLLYSLASGYEFLLQRKQIDEIFGRDISFLDKRLISDLTTIHSTKPIHILSGFIIKQLLQKTGPLVDIVHLSARLGIDYLQSTDWEKLMEILDASKYNGVYSGGWQRWWFSLIEKWWADNFPDKILRLLSAKDRVNLISEKYNLKLKPYQKTARSKSDKFWTICKGTLVPIDPTDGFIVGDQDNFYPWQEKEYISIDEALERKFINIWKTISSLEKNRYEKLIKTIEGDGGN